MIDPPAGFDRSDWKAWPHTAWAFRNTEHILPTAVVEAGETATTLPFAPNQRFDPIIRHENRRLGWTDYLVAVHATSAIVVRNGRIVAETYRDGMRASDRHTLFSITKSVIGLTALLLADTGRIDLRKPVGAYVPELDRTAFAGACLDDLLAMRDGIPFDEDYARADAQIHRYSRHYWGDASGGALAALKQLDQSEARRGSFAYRTPVADVVALTLHRATGRSLAELVSDVIWKPIGAEGDAYLVRDTAGAEIGGTGFGARPRDMARLALALLSILEAFPASALATFFRSSGTAEYAITNVESRQGWSYNWLWWHPNRGAAAAMGVHGQRIMIDRSTASALLLTGAAPAPSTRHLDDLHAAAFGAVTS